MLAKASNDFSPPIRKDSCRLSSCVNVCLHCVIANRHSVLSYRRSLTAPMIAPHSCAWQRLSQHSSLACAVRRKRLVSLNARKSCDSWLKTFWSARIPLPFATAFPYPQVRPKTVDPTTQTAQITFCVRGVISPLLANGYLHYVFDLWVQHWRTHRAKGEVIVVRYADDMVLGFQHRAEAERFLQDWRERLQKFELELHPDKTRLIEFGRFAAIGRKQRGEGKPETFNFLGFTHICGQSWKNGKFFVLRKTIRKRLLAKLKQVKIALWKRMHQSLAEVGKWLRRVVQGYFNYHAIPGNLASLRSFRREVRKRWLRVIRRRSQRSGMTWELLDRFAAEWLPEPKILHPYPNLRFDAKHPRSTLRVSSSYRRSLRTDRTAGRFLKGCWGKAVIRYHLPRRVRSGLPISLADCDGAFSPVLFF